MNEVSLSPNQQQLHHARARELAGQRRDAFNRVCDRIFALLIELQWIAAIAMTFIISPKTYNGLASSTHPHMYAAIFLGGIISAFPVYLAYAHPGRALTRQAVAVAQLAWSALLIHVSGGRIETHFHIFGSLALLSWYRDWRVLLTATVVTLIHHLFFTAYLPQSIFGVTAATEWRTMEHAWWVIFEVGFLLIAMRHSLHELLAGCLLQASLENSYEQVADEVRRQTIDLQRANERARAGETFLSRVGKVAGVGGWQIELANSELTWTDETRRLHEMPLDCQPTIEQAIAFYAPEARPIIAAAVEQGMKFGRGWDLELPLVTATGKHLFVRAMGEVQFEDASPKRIVGAIQDVTLRRSMEDALRIAARTDKLTGLPNRALLCERLQQAVLAEQKDPSQRFALMFLDFDRFKSINDTLGHDIGDLLLKEIATRLQKIVRFHASGQADTRNHVTARHGGDEFVVLIDQISGVDEAQLFADRLLREFKQTYQLAEHEVVSTASIGVVLSGSASDTADNLLRDADTAMYAAKAAGKARYVMFDEAMRGRVQHRVELENDLAKAVAAGELQVAYQPIVSLSTGTVDSYEALLRWNHPRHGQILPGEFIPIAEETGLIIPIGEWVVAQACAQMATWRATLGQATPRVVSVNLSRKQLHQPGLAETLHEIINRSGVPASCLQLEVTESAVMRDPAAAVEVLKSIALLGVELSMDDFGIGYSSLSCLREFPIDVLKIDRSFIANLTHGREYAALVQAMTQLARNLNIKVVAEGVETMDQAQMLQALDCELAQGKLFGSPSTAQEVLEMPVLRYVIPRTTAA